MNKHWNTSKATIIKLFKLIIGPLKHPKEKIKAQDKAISALKSEFKAQFKASLSYEKN